MIHLLLKPGLDSFEHYCASVRDECNCAVVWAFFGISFFGIGMKADLFQFCGHCWVFQICWCVECLSFTASSFRIWNSSMGIPSSPLALFTEKSMAWKIPWMEEPGRLQSMGSLRVRHDWASSLSLFTFMHWRRIWQHTPVFLPGESQGLGSLVSGVAQSRTQLKWLSSSHMF